MDLKTFLNLKNHVTGLGMLIFLFYNTALDTSCRLIVINFNCYVYSFVNTYTVRQKTQDSILVMSLFSGENCVRIRVLEVSSDSLIP